MHKFRHRLAVVAGLLFIASLPVQTSRVARAQNNSPDAERQTLREIFQELIEINTVDPHGDVTRAAEAMRARLLAAGFAAEDVRVVVPAGNAKKGNLVARYRSPQPAGKPLLLLAHIDVVEARKEDWSDGLDPFKLTERDGYYYGRGTMDDKAMAAIFIANLIRFKRENFQPDRDIIVALTTDEETGDFNGVEFLLKDHRALVDAEFGINEGGRGYLKAGKPLLNAVQASEKVYQSFRLEVRNKGGHSSLPVKDNAIFRLASGLDRLAQFDFPVNLNEVTRSYFERMSKIETGQVAADMRAVAAAHPKASSVARLSASPYYNALMRTTCVATRLEGGHADNALPQMARATINCRILPQENAADVQATLKRVLSDDQISITPIAVSKPSPPSPLRPEIMGAIERLTSEMWPGVPVVPIMGTGATDSLFFRQVGIPVYGVSGIFDDIDDNRTHGRDERIAVKSLHDGREFLYRLTKAFSSVK
ncbi:MAG TPA: M20/M25/M40 family metallo-hydrolase [Pyrinomonadaceae bacterium]|jgi:acetylornithine deacetylase/succinyl-diaminopimelate desuccinylase-like protein|nr:M20/M25/M40 family metallo-hydrolase [Pyrinomonadaceae bacterium]